MAAQQLNWTIDIERGTIRFGRVVPFAGNTYPLEIVGGRHGSSYAAYVMACDGVTCVARSEGGEIAFNGADLREAFRECPHEARSFHVYVRDGESTVAEGDLRVEWNPLWQDAGSPEPYTMKGPKGDPGNPGVPGDKGDAGLSAYEVAVAAGYEGTVTEWLMSLKGAPGSALIVRQLDSAGDETDVWHKIYCFRDKYGKLALAVGNEDEENTPDFSAYVTRTGDQTVSDVKTFTSSPLVPMADQDGEDSSQKAASTSWVSKWWARAWQIARNAMLGTSNVWRAAQTFVAGASFGAPVDFGGGVYVSGSDGVASIRSGSSSVEVDANGARVTAPTMSVPAPSSSHSSKDSVQAATVGWVNSTGNNVLHLDGAETVSGRKSFTAANSHTGAETHSGAEAHSGAETHSGTETFSATQRFTKGIRLEHDVATTSTTPASASTIPVGFTARDGGSFGGIDGSVGPDGSVETLVSAKRGGVSGAISLKASTSGSTVEVSADHLKVPEPTSANDAAQLRQVESVSGFITAGMVVPPNATAFHEMCSYSVRGRSSVVVQFYLSANTAYATIRINGVDNDVRPNKVGLVTSVFDVEEGGATVSVKVSSTSNVAMVSYMVFGKGV